MADAPRYASFGGGKDRKGVTLQTLPAKSLVSSSEMAGSLLCDCLALLIRYFKC